MYFKGQKTIKLESGQELPVIGLGTHMMTGDNDIEILVRAVVELGYRHIDTASRYMNEEKIGEALKMIFAKGVKREDLFITTKLWTEDKGEPRKAIETSLSKLGLDYVDLYLIHWPMNFIKQDGGYKTMKWPLSKTWAAMEKLVDDGLAKNIGLSNYNCQIINDLLTYCRIKPAVNQIELHPYLRQHYLTKWLYEKNIVPVAYSPLGKPDWADDKYHVMKNPLILELAEKYKKSPGVICLNWGLSQNYVVIPKSSNYDRLKDNIEAGNFEMSEEDIERINQLDMNFRVIDFKAGKMGYDIPIFD